MRVSLRPDRLFSDYSGITPELLHEKGIKLLLCDLDYTLAPKAVKTPPEGVKAWIDGLKAAGITVMILSNNRSGKRVNDSCRTLGIDYVGHAQKPSPKGLRRAWPGQASQNARPPCWETSC